MNRFQSPNAETIEDDYLTPYHRRPDRDKKTKQVAYCTSEKCVTKVRRIYGKKTSYKIDGYIEIKNPPKDGWCRKCGSALFFTEEKL